MSQDYECAACGGVFEKTWTDEESMAESRAIFGSLPPEELAIVCDDCWKAMGLPSTEAEA